MKKKKEVLKIEKTLVDKLKNHLDSKEYRPRMRVKKNYENGKLKISEEMCFDIPVKKLCGFINEFIEYDSCGYIQPSGIYMIEDFYIGQTSNIVQRLAFHILEPFFEEYGFNNFINKEKSKLILEILKTRKLKVKLIDSDLKKEMEYIKEYSSNGYLLTNKIGVPKHLRKDRILKEKMDKLNNEIEKNNI